MNTSTSIRTCLCMASYNINQIVFQVNWSYGSEKNKQPFYCLPSLVKNQYIFLWQTRTVLIFVNINTCRIQIDLQFPPITITVQPFNLISISICAAYPNNLNLSFLITKLTNPNMSIWLQHIHLIMFTPVLTLHVSHAAFSSGALWTDIRKLLTDCACTVLFRCNPYNNCHHLHKYVRMRLFHHMSNVLEYLKHSFYCTTKITSCFKDTLYVNCTPNKSTHS